MDKNKVYIWYSPATDITGKKLQDALGIQGGRTKPTGMDMVIGWGTKIKEETSLPKKVNVVNHPNQIRTNRNKFEAMCLMTAALNVDGKMHVAKHVTADQVKAALRDGTVSLPLIGRRKYHQGGKGFWNCPTMAQVDNALAVDKGAQYFQEMIPIKDEYRLHVFNGEVIHAVKKVKRTDAEFEAAFIEDELERQRVLAEKNNDPFDEEQARRFLRRQAKSATAGGPNMVLRSNRLGWKFSIVKKYSKDMAEVAVKAVEALNLKFGAVDCCIDTNNNPFVFEVNSGPGLEGTSFDKYIEAFEKLISGKTDKSKAKKDVTETKKGKPATGSTAAARKEILTAQLTRLRDMVEEANEDELDTIERLGTKIIFGDKD